MGIEVSLVKEVLHMVMLKVVILGTLLEVLEPRRVAIVVMAEPR
jgi:hypothetical protein